MENLSLYDLSKDVINHILTFTDNKTFVNCLKTSKIFNIQDYNLNCKNNYLEHKYSNISIDELSKKGDIEGVKYLYYMGETYTDLAIFYAIRYGHFKLVRWFCKYIVEFREWSRDIGMDCAAQYGHIEILQFLDYYIKGDCTDDAMNWAAHNGYLEIVEWLCENRIEGCTTVGILYAARNGHFEIIKFLWSTKWAFYKIKRRDFKLAIQWAKEQGHKDIVNFLKSQNKINLSKINKK